MKFLVFQHLDIEHPGSLRDFWKKEGISWDTVELDEGDEIPGLDEYHALIVMGGPQMTWEEDIYPWLEKEKAAIAYWVRVLQKPFLGICLGHQLLASSLDGKVVLGETSEVGLASVELNAEGVNDPLFKGFDKKNTTFQWHSAEVSVLPSDALTLAFNDICPIQAFRVGQHAYGLQYHVEITEKTVLEWMAVPEYSKSLEESLGKTQADNLEAITLARLPEFYDSAKRLNDNFLSIVRNYASSSVVA